MLPKARFPFPWMRSRCGPWARGPWPEISSESGPRSSTTRSSSRAPCWSWPRNARHDSPGSPIRRRRAFHLRVAEVTTTLQTADPPRALLIDDDAAIRDLLCEVLGFLGFQVDAVASGVAGLALFEQRAYDLVVT